MLGPAESRGMKSSTATEPSSVWWTVSSTSVPGMYRRSVLVTSTVGRIDQCPFDSSPNRLAKQAPPSTSGTHHQSIDPDRSTSADVRVSPIRP